MHGFIDPKVTYPSANMLVLARYAFSGLYLVLLTAEGLFCLIQSNFTGVFSI